MRQQQIAALHVPIRLSDWPRCCDGCQCLQAPKSQIEGLDSMRTFVEERNYWLEALGDKVHVMGSITDSHDIPRWLAEGNDDMSRYRWVRSAQRSERTL